MELLKSTMADRRSENPESSVWWDKLSLAQKFSASSLSKFGYEVICIRDIEGEKFAILQCDDGVATVSYEGEINVHSDVNLRT